MDRDARRFVDKKEIRGFKEYPFFVIVAVQRFWYDNSPVGYPVAFDIRLLPGFGAGRGTGHKGIGYLNFTTLRDLELGRNAFAVDTDEPFSEESIYAREGHIGQKTPQYAVNSPSVIVFGETVGFKNHPYYYTHLRHLTKETFYRKY